MVIRRLPSDRKTTFRDIIFIFIILSCSLSPCRRRLLAPGWPARTACWRPLAGPPGDTRTFSAPQLDPCDLHTTPPAAPPRPSTPPYHSSADVAMDKVLPTDLSAAVPEIEVEQNGAQAGCRHRQVAEVLLVPGDVPLQGHSVKRCLIVSNSLISR